MRRRTILSIGSLSTAPLIRTQPQKEGRVADMLATGQSGQRAAENWLAAYPKLLVNYAIQE